MERYFFSEATAVSVPITVIQAQDFVDWLAAQTDRIKNWVDSQTFTAKVGSYCLLYNHLGNVEQVLLGLDVNDMFTSFGDLAKALPALIYHLDHDACSANIDLQLAALAWGMGAYEFTRYKESQQQFARLLLRDNVDHAWLKHMLKAIFMVRDLINTPADDMGPAELAAVAAELAQQFNATIHVITGEELLQDNYPAIYAVGRASRQAPRLLDLRWGACDHPKVTLVGKGVCFDTGGLDLKPSSGMLLMKKDMGGAAHVLGLAYLIMALELPIQLRVLIPAVENAIGGNALRPSDIITMRNGLTVEIGNTDAEGRVVLADALAEARRDNPDLVIDFATLTGAARAAVGTEITSFFTDSDSIAAALMTAAKTCQDPVWRLPLYQPYRKLLNSPIADINNISKNGYAGATIAALFLQEFIGNDKAWLHFDLMAYNINSRPGHPEGGEAMGLRAVFAYLQQCPFTDKNAV